MKKLTTILILTLVIFGCEKENNKVNTKPYIEFINISPENVQEFKEKITITIFYRDENGDLGENNPEIKNLFLKDNRNNIIYEYRIEQLAPDNANISIQGNLNIELNGTGITNEENEQTVTFDIYIIDRSGNQSNTVSSTPIVIYK